jgi:hypothetical protein
MVSINKPNVLNFPIFAVFFIIILYGGGIKMKKKSSQNYLNLITVVNRVYIAVMGKLFCLWM